MAQDHGVFHNKVANCTVLPVVDLDRLVFVFCVSLSWLLYTYIAAANTGEFDVDDHIVGVFEFGYWTVFILDLVNALEDEREVLKM